MAERGGGATGANGGDGVHTVPHAGDAVQILAGVPQLQVYAPAGRRQ